MELTIEYLKAGDPFQTKYGTKRKWRVGSGGEYYDSFIDAWNTGWKKGDTVTANVKMREYNGKTYKDLVKPDGYTQGEISTTPNTFDVEARAVLMETYKNTEKIMSHLKLKDELPPE